jgi:hypothetical protein
MPILKYSVEENSFYFREIVFNVLSNELTEDEVNMLNLRNEMIDLFIKNKYKEIFKYYIYNSEKWV